MIPQDDDHQLQRVMTVPEIATALRVSRATVYRLVNTGALPGMRVGKTVRVTRRAVQEFTRTPTPQSPP
jgi:excisionase family DNA binding protein